MLAPTLLLFCGQQYLDMSSKIMVRRYCFPADLSFWPEEDDPDRFQLLLLLLMLIVVNINRYLNLEQRLASGIFPICRGMPLDKMGPGFVVRGPVVNQGSGYPWMDQKPRRPIGFS